MHVHPVALQIFVSVMLASTRALYERKLEGLLQPASQPKLNGTGDTGQYSDSEEEEDISGMVKMNGRFLLSSLYLVWLC